MKINKNLGLIVLAVYFILHGLITLVNFSFAGLGTIMGILALVAGILILFFDKPMA
ncbi:MAG TPA: hypothetical protein VEH83_05190 [Gemmatimonadales bacterium]|nr:hypothetical protein [Gemmatimonadales bacterium]